MLKKVEINHKIEVEKQGGNKQITGIRYKNHDVYINVKNFHYLCRDRKNIGSTVISVN